MSFSVGPHFDCSELFNGKSLLNTLDPIEVISAIIGELDKRYSSCDFVECLNLIKNEFAAKLMLFNSFFANNTPLNIIELLIPKVFVAVHTGGVAENSLSMAFKIIKDIKAMSKLMLVNGYSAEQACKVHFRQPHASGHCVEFCM